MIYCKDCGRKAHSKLHYIGHIWPGDLVLSILAENSKLSRLNQNHHQHSILPTACMWRFNV